MIRRYLIFTYLKERISIKFALAMNGIMKRRYGVKVPNKVPLNNDAREGININGRIFLISNCETENIKRKFTILPIIICGCLKRNGTKNVMKYITVSWNLSLLRIFLSVCFWSSIIPYYIPNFYISLTH